VAGDEMKLLRDIEKVTRQKIPSTDRRNDKSLALLDQSIMASGVKSKPPCPTTAAATSRNRAVLAIPVVTASRHRTAASRIVSAKAIGVRAAEIVL
jgi:hypothetical protein